MSSRTSLYFKKNKQGGMKAPRLQYKSLHFCELGPLLQACLCTEVQHSSHLALQCFPPRPPPVPSHLLTLTGWHWVMSPVSMKDILKGTAGKHDRTCLLAQH